MKQGFYIALFTIYLFSCKKENNCFVPSGKPASETVYLDAFSSIEVNDFMDVNWQESSEYKIEIEEVVFSFYSLDNKFKFSFSFTPMGIIKT